MAAKRNNKNKILFRYGIITLMFLFLASLIVIKLFTNTIVEAQGWNERAKKDLSRMDIIMPARGKILSDNGNILACNINVYDTKIDLSHAAIKNIKGGIPWKEIDQLADSLDKYYPLCKNLNELKGEEFEENSWHKKLEYELGKKPEDRTKRLMVAKKKTLDDFARIKSFPFLCRFEKKKGYHNPVYTEVHSQRCYPYGSMARRSIGRVNEREDGQIHGFSGVEHDLDSFLFGKTGLARKVTLTSGVTNWVAQPAIRGYDVYTTFDIDLQDMLEEELTNICTDANATWGTAIIMEVATGEIKAIANVQKMGDGTYGESLNRAYRGFEPGSVMKPISLMIAFEDGLVKSVNDMVDCSPFQRTSDPHAPGTKSMKQVIEMSSNTGIARVIFRGYAKQPEKFYDRLESIGFFEPLVAGITYNETPNMRRLTEIDKYGRRRTMTERHLDLARQAYGYNTTIPPIYTLAIYNAIANNGKFVRPHVMRRYVNDLVDSVIPQQYVRERICSEKTARMMKECLKEPVWGSHGTARAVQDDRVMIAGKTGTAYPMRSDSGGGYDTSRRRYAFAGFFPYDNPKYSCMALILAGAGTSANRTSGQVVKNMALKMFARGMLDNVSTFTRNKATDAPLMVNTKKASISVLASNLKLSNIKTFSSRKSDHDKSKTPDVIGYDAPTAVRMLESRGLNVTAQGVGKVVAQSLPAGTPIKKGSKIKLTLKI
ncbi:MAG: PASTA domain-containing protein [Muribaculaceae bacterium]|nr:PASTA domain-containing protein [Muribaculaceae bacterium]